MFSKTDFKNHQPSNKPGDLLSLSKDRRGNQHPTLPDQPAAVSRRQILPKFNLDEHLTLGTATNTITNGRAAICLLLSQSCSEAQKKARVDSQIKPLPIPTGMGAVFGEDGSHRPGIPFSTVLDCTGKVCAVRNSLSGIGPLSDHPDQASNPAGLTASVNRVSSPTRQKAAVELFLSDAHTQNNDGSLADPNTAERDQHRDQKLADTVAQVDTSRTVEASMTDASETLARGTLARQYQLLLTKQHMAELLGRTIRTIYRLESQGRIPSSVNVGNQRMWIRDEIMHWIDSSCPSRRVWEKLHPKYRKKTGGC